MRRFLLSTGLFALLFAPASFAQSAPLPCNGALTRVRISTIKPGMMPQFEKAVAANLAWYRNQGITTNSIVLARIIDRNPVNRTYKYSDTEAIVYHFNPPGNNPTDPGYKAFVQMYTDSSTIKLEYTVCMPSVPDTTPTPTALPGDLLRPVLP